MTAGSSFPFLWAIAGRLLCADCVAEHCAANPTHLDTEREPTREEIVAGFYACDVCECAGEQAIRDGRLSRG